MKTRSEKLAKISLGTIGLLFLFYSMYVIRFLPDIFMFNEMGRYTYYAVPDLTPLLGFLGFVHSQDEAVLVGAFAYTLLGILGIVSFRFFKDRGIYLWYGIAGILCIGLFFQFYFVGYYLNPAIWMARAYLSIGMWRNFLALVPRLLPEIIHFLFIFILFLLVFIAHVSIMRRKRLVVYEKSKKLGLI